MTGIEKLCRKEVRNSDYLEQYKFLCSIYHYFIGNSLDSNQNEGRNE